MSRVIRRSAFALAFVCAAGVAEARAQRVGPTEDDRAATDGAKTAAERKDAKTGAKSATKVEPKVEPKRDAAEAKRDQAHAPASTASVAPTPLGERTAASAAVAATPDPTQTQAPVPVSPSIGALPAPLKYEPPPPIKAEVPASPPSASGAVNNSTAAATPAPPSSIYRPGVGDILDIRLVNGMSKDFTLYTVLSNGTVDYPLAGEPVVVAGLTTDEIGARLSAALKRRGIFERAQFQISVRDYVSHTVMVSGLVEQPGQKVLRREAVPLYVVLAEAFPRADAGRAVVISRATGRTRTFDLADSNALNELVLPGDVINLQPRPQEFYYVGGQVGSPGQRDFHAGITLTQAILAAGGVSRAGKRTVVTVSRQGADGRLTATDYVLQEIEEGRAPDPRVQPGDRIEIGRKR
ncbi:MAG: polysaccharide biosynthesis/export family protein [Acidobacteria bacterium]|nr:polysaccharide biosynthesis/export family protein [Acidobacteriota bacterium]MCA1642411.1 polysaccharide biosynthesis/export family protein [Acidobacteriota bacterium]